MYLSNASATIAAHCDPVVFTYAHKPSVVFHQSALYHFYCAVFGKWPNEIRGISVARFRPW